MKDEKDKDTDTLITNSLHINFYRKMIQYHCSQYELEKIHT